MGMLSYKELSGKSLKELISMRNDTSRKLMNLRFQKASGDTSINSSEFGKSKRYIARVNTCIKINFLDKVKRGN